MTCPICGQDYPVIRGWIAAHGTSRAAWQRDERSQLCRGSSTRAPAGPLFEASPCP